MVETLQAALDVSSTSSAGRPRARFGLARLTLGDDPTHATAMLLEVVDGAEHFGLRSELWHARFNLGVAAMLEDDPDRAQAAFEETYRWATEVGEDRLVACCCNELACLSLIHREFETARSLVLESFAAVERLESLRVIAHCLETQGCVELAGGRLDDARRAFTGALQLEDDMWSLLGLPVRLGLASVALAAGDVSAAVRRTQDALSNLEDTQQFHASHVDYLLVIAACIHSSIGNSDRAAALKALVSRQTVWGRREPMNGWLAAVEQTAGTLAIRYPTRLDLLREILAFNEAVESH